MTNTKWNVVLYVLVLLVIPVGALCETYGHDRLNRIMFGLQVVENWKIGMFGVVCFIVGRTTRQFLRRE